MKTLFQFLTESTAVQQATRMGLKSDGHGGWYDNKGEFVAKTDKGQLKFFKMNIEELIQSFESKSTNRKQRFNDFLYHAFISFENILKNKKLKRKSDKYIQMRQKLINYLIANERKVTMKLCR